MKLAEALAARADMQKKIGGLQQRILTNLRVQEGEEPHEPPEALLAQMHALYAEQCALLQRINARNNAVSLPDGRTLAEALVERESLLSRRNALSQIVQRGSERDIRLTHTEVKVRVTLSIAALQKQVDDLSRAYRELDTQIQGMNWTVEL